VLALATGALAAHRLRTRATGGAIAIGMGAVVLLTALGEGARRWIAESFTALGSNVLVVMPGRTETRGGPPIVASTTRDLTLADCDALSRRMPGVRTVVPIVIGEAPVKHAGRTRPGLIVGSTAAFLEVRGAVVAAGASLPSVDATRGVRVCVIGRTVQRELFGEVSPLGRRVRIGRSAFRVVGILGPSGRSMMMNLDETVLVPVADAMAMFDRRGLFRILVQVSAASELASAERRAVELVSERHGGEEDFTVLTPGAIASSLEGIVGLVTAGLAGIAAISLAVAGIGVMNVMVVAVAERRAEIGLMKALGASNRQVLALFLAEAGILTCAGGLGGIAGGVALARLARALYPTIPFQAPWWSVEAALGVSLAVGVVFGIAPAMSASRVEPVAALRGRR